MRDGIPKDGYTLDAGVLYGAGRDEVSDLVNFKTFEFESWRISTATAFVIEVFRPCNVGGWNRTLPKDGPDPKMTEKESRVVRMEAMKDSVRTCLGRYPDIGLAYYRPGARAHILELEASWSEANPVVVKQSDGNCLTAALAHVVHVLCGRESALVARDYLNINGIVFGNLREISNGLSAIKLPFSLVKLNKVRRAAFQSNPCRFLGQGGGGETYFVIAPGDPLHWLVFDTRRKLIWDSMEPYAIRAIGRTVGLLDGLVPGPRNVAAGELHFQMGVVCLEGLKTWEKYVYLGR